MPLPYHPLYKNYKSKIPNAKYIWKQLVSLPLSRHQIRANKLYYKKS